MSDSEVEIVEKADTSRPGNTDICQFCTTSLASLSTAEREKHYTDHNFTRSGESNTGLKRGRSWTTSSAAPREKKISMTSRKSAKSDAEDIFWYPRQVVAPPKNYSPGVLSILKDALKNARVKDTTKRAVLCYERTPHILRQPLDSSWGCGYRNFMIACAALMDQQVQTAYHQKLESPLPPGILNLQQWIEDAWDNGYDDHGACELDRKLTGTKKKIGTADLYVAFTSRKIPCTLLDFNLKNSPKGFDTVIDWVVSYFTEKPTGDVNTILCNTTPITASSRMPVIMQWDGHSVTIVGYEVGKNGKRNLLVFDPSSAVPSNIRQVAVSGITVGGVSPSTSPNKNKHGGQPRSPASKRLRIDQDVEEIVSIPDSEDEKTEEPHQAGSVESNADPDKVIKPFRLKAKHMKKDDYQLLCFTMGDALEDQEQSNRKIVFSERVC